MAARRLTITFFAAMRRAPRDRVTETTIGSSSGVSPTASATAKRNDSRSGRCFKVLTRMTKSTISMARRRISSPKLRVPASKAVGGAGVERLVPISPRVVSAPVAQISTRAEPLTAVVPMNTAPVASFIARSGGASAAGCFSTG